MKIGVVAQQKGGDGKTSSIVHLAFDFLERDLRIGVLDLDPQKNSSSSLRQFASGYTASKLFEPNSTDNLHAALGGLPEGPLVCLIEADDEMADVNTLKFSQIAEHFKANIEAMAQHLDVLLIDTAPSLNVSLRAALNIADCVLSPIQMQKYSIDGIRKLLTVIGNMQKRNPKLQFLGMLPNMVDGRDPMQMRNLAALKAKYPQLMIPVEIHRRGSIADAMATGIPVWKIKKTTARPAAQEVRAVAAYVHEKMEIGV